MNRRPDNARRSAHTSARSWIAAFMILTLAGTSGCGSVGKNIGLGLVATGGMATVTTGILALGCTTPNQNNPQLETRGPCLPPQTYEDTKAVLWTTFVLGIIVTAAGVAVIATIDEKRRNPDPPRKRPPEPREEESCKDAKYCY